MSRFDVKVIPNQEEVNSVDVPSHERDMLLSKYGYSNSNCVPSQPIPDQNNETFEEMIKNKLVPVVNRPDPNVTYVSDPDTGFNFKVTINKI